LQPTFQMLQIMNAVKRLFLLLVIAGSVSCRDQSAFKPIVLQTDFGVKDGAVTAMKGVIESVDPHLKVYDLTHEIPAYNIWEAAYRLEQTAQYWPKGTVFVSVVDPGVGTERKSVVLKTKSGHYFVTPDNGTLTLISESLGIGELREIDSITNRRKGSQGSYTFHGRDVYAYTAARLAAGVISFTKVGPRLADTVVKIAYQKAIMQGGSISGNIPILDIQYGNVWTNIPDSLFKKLNITYGDSVAVKISNADSTFFDAKIPFVKTFGEVSEGKTLAYFNSLMNFSLAVNMGNFSESYAVKSGPEWKIVLSK
jgi:S-adenosylmethionine hydrolase